MNVFDWVLILVFALTALWGYKTGLIDAALNAITIYVGLFLSGLFAARVLSLFWDGVESESVSTAIGYVIIFVTVFIASRIVSGIIKKALKITFMGWVDNLGGIVIGLVAGMLIARGGPLHLHHSRKYRRPDISRYSGHDPTGRRKLCGTGCQGQARRFSYRIAASTLTPRSARGSYRICTGRLRSSPRYSRIPN